MSEIRLSGQDTAFLKRRAALVRAWPLAGGIALAALIVLAGWMFWRSPLLVNPYSMMERIREGSFEPGTLQLLAGLLPIAVLSTLALAGALIAFAFAAFSNEKKHLRIIAGLLGTDAANKHQR